jgi:hypothetical protein
MASVGAASRVRGLAANTGAGVARLALDATSEAQEATLYFNDQLAFDVTKGPWLRLSGSDAVLPSAGGVEAVFGLMSTRTSAPDTNSFYFAGR